jgi:hypothetical protein
VTGVQTCALPISEAGEDSAEVSLGIGRRLARREPVVDLHLAGVGDDVPRDAARDAHGHLGDVAHRNLDGREDGSGRRVGLQEGVVGDGLDVVGDDLARLWVLRSGRQPRCIRVRIA